jgi:Ca-activated chloride channel family protein
MRSRRLQLALVAALAASVVIGTRAQEPGPAPASEQAPFKSGVELVNVDATVIDEDGRFVPELTKDDFAIFEDNQPQEIAYFASERVPVSLGILLDVSGSMTEDKMASARSAIDRLVLDLLGPEDEVFFMQFSTRPRLLESWTRDKNTISRAVRRVNATGGTAMYDAIAEALPLAGTGGNRKKALLVISDGNDTNSWLSVGQLRQTLRESEVLVYALGVDGTAPARQARPVPRRTPLPFPIPNPGRPGGRLPLPFPFPQINGGGLPQIGGGGGRWQFPPAERVNGDALRLITDDSGGRTEIVKGFGDLVNATTRIADELSKQYALGYVSPGKHDGKWHAIKVTVRDRDLTVRARRGYIAS